MRKILSFLGIGLLALMLAVPASAAAKPIAVYINGSKVSFPAGSPYLKNNAVLVPFRVIFEQLGLQVLWNPATSTVTGTSADLSVSLKVGSSRATVNGIAKTLSTAPVASAGTTYVPLRFIAEATGGAAVWNPASQSVQITTKQATAEDKAAIQALITLSNQYFNEEKAKEFYSLMDSSQTYVEAIADLDASFKEYNLKSTIESFEIIDLKPNEATVYAVESLRRVSGPYTPDQEDEYLYTLIREKGGWRISSVESETTKILLTREEAMKSVTVPQADADAIKATINQYYKSLNDQSPAGVIAAMTSYGEEYDASVQADLEDFFATYDITYTTGATNIYYYSDKNAAIYVESKDKESGDSQTYEQGNIFILSKSDNGSWTIDDFNNIF